MGSAPSKQQSPVTSQVNEKQQSVLTTGFSSLSLSQKTPASADGALTLANVDSWEEEIAAEPKLQLARTILNHSDVRTALQSRSAIIADSHVFNTEVDFKTGPITNQKSSGRCWLFATTNVLRYNVMKKFNLNDFQLSQVSPLHYFTRRLW